MDELRQLLESFGLDADNPDYTSLTDEQLGELQTGLFDLFDTARDADIPDLPLLEAIADGGEAIRHEDDARQEQAASDAQRVDELVASVDRQRPVRTRTVSLVDLARNRRASMTPQPEDSTAAGGGFVAQTGDRVGQSVTAAGIAELAIEQLRSLEGLPIQPGQRIHLARARADYSDAQILDDSSSANGARIEAMVAAVQAQGLEEGLTAAGGRCGPATPRYDQDVVGSDARPVRDALTPFQGRGAVRYILPPTLADIVTAGSTAAIGLWTDAMDQAAINDAGTRKPIQRVVCGDELTVETEAITERLLIGVSLSRSNPERVRAFVDLVNVAQARFAEQRLLARIKAGSTQAAEDFPIVLGSRRDLLAVWAKTAWAIRNRNRMAEDTPVRLIIPDAVITHAQIDGIRQLPGDGRDRLTREEVLGEMRNLGVAVTITPDMPAHLAPAQAAGAQLVDLPAPIEWHMSVEGTWGFLDGGTFDLGFEALTPIRDTATLSANDLQLFAETWERAVRFLGTDSIWGRTMVAPTGEVAGTVDVSLDTAS